LSTVYLYDHLIHPVNREFNVYKQFESILKIKDFKNDLRLGSLVTNISRINLNELVSFLKEYKMYDNNFDLGLGIGDNKYEQSHENGLVNLDEFISNLISEFIFQKNGLTLFLGGISEPIKRAALDYNLGRNIWKFHHKNDLYAFSSDQKDIIGRNSICFSLSEMKDISLPSGFEEVILVIKDSSFRDYVKQLDNIKQWMIN